MTFFLSFCLENNKFMKFYTIVLTFTKNTHTPCFFSFYYRFKNEFMKSYCFWCMFQEVYMISFLCVCGKRNTFYGTRSWVTFFYVLVVFVWENTNRWDTIVPNVCLGAVCTFFCFVCLVRVGIKFVELCHFSSFFFQVLGIILYLFSF